MDGNDIVLFLLDNEVKAYLPGQHSGECKERYVVVKAQMRNPIIGISSSWQRYDVLCYVPQNERSKLEAFVSEIETTMRELGKTMAIRSMNTRSPDFYDSDVRGHMMSTAFQVYYKNE